MNEEALQKENLHLRRAVDELAFLNELSAAIGSSFNSGEIMKTIIKKSVRSIKAEQGAIILVTEDDTSNVQTLVRTVVSSADHKPFSLNQNLIGWMHINKKPLKIADPENDSRFSGIEWDISMSSIACVPLLVKSKLIGILATFNKKTEKEFSDDDVRLLTIIAAQSAQIIENARLYEDEQELIKFREESRMAAQIQKNLLPKSDPDIPGYDIAGKSLPALEVGGDYYDFIPLEDDKTVICLGDISGKGMPAAMLMSNLQAAVRSLIMADHTPKNCLEKTNKLLYNSTEMNRFATFFYCILSPDECEICFTNAGHDPPLLMKKDGSVSMLKAGGPVIGFVDPVEYLQDTMYLEPGEMIVIYTDGVTEAWNSDEVEFGEERFQDLLKEIKDLPSKDIINRVVEEVKIHSDGYPQSDDITMIVIKKL
ncbi:MAG: SpoIIE family protein phosphatase [bacterium]|nr:SpoIIE family protein phosphatase [bacterium]